MFSRSHSLLSHLYYPYLVACFGLCALLTPAPAVAASTELPVPAHTSLVVDQANLLSPQEQEELRGALTRFQETRGPQLQLLTIPTIAGDSLEGFSIRVVDAWKLGKKGKDDGVLLLIVASDKKMRIEVGRGLEGDLTDALTGRILDQGVRPYFREGRFRDGIYNGLGLIAQALGGSLSGADSENYGRYGHRRNANPRALLLLLFLIVALISRLQSAGYRRGYGGWWGGGGWGGGGFGGGGFGGGGGGGFSGGGASSDW